MERVINPTEEIKLTVDYTKTVEQAITDGNYDWKNDDIIVKNFPISPEMIGKKVEVVTKLFYFNRDISSNDGISEMEKADYRPATLMELLALGAVLVTLVACLFWSSVALGVGFASLGLFMTGAFIVFSLVSASEIKKPVSK